MRALSPTEPVRRGGPVLTLALALLALVLCAGGGLRAQAVPLAPARFVGASACAECHPALAEEWHRGRHSKMLQPATATSVLGDFSKGQLRLRGERFRLRASEAGVFISESGLSGSEQEHRVDFTLGSRRIQHYLTRLPNGWIAVLPPTWDVERREWFHNLEIVRPDEDAKAPLQVWNKNCHGCHVSEQAKNYDPAGQSYATSWRDAGTNCERCHGPASRHVERFQEKERFAGDPERYIVKPTRLDPQKATAVCAQCHSLRDVVAEGYTAGGEYYDHFLPLLEYGPRSESDPAWWADGRPRRFSNDALGLWQSQCYLQGKATCTTCHRDPHEPDVEKNPELLSSNERLCTRCHDAIGKDVPAHSHHAASSRGSSCVECHMPPTVFSIKAAIRDHSISVPAPENSMRFAIPNACNVCHADKKPQWAADRLREWGVGNRRARLVARALAFTLGRAGKPEAVARLGAIARDAAESPLIRANAVGYLTRYENPEAQAAVLLALRSPEPLLRAVAALNLGASGLPAQAAQAALVGALGDERRVVRVSAAFSLVGLGVPRLPGEDGRRFEAAKADYVARGRFHSDDAAAQFDLGKFQLLNGEYAAATAAFQQSGALDKGRRLDYFLALAEMGQGHTAEARARLEQIESGDPFAEPARKLLSKLAAGK